VVKNNFTTTSCVIAFDWYNAPIHTYIRDTELTDGVLHMSGANGRLLYNARRRKTPWRIDIMDTPENLNTEEPSPEMHSEEASNAEEGSDNESGATEGAEEELSPHVKGAISALKRKHQRDLRRRDERHEALQYEIEMLKQRHGHQPMSNLDPYGSVPPSGNEGMHANVDDPIQRAVTIALQHREREERHRQEAENHQKVQKMHADFNRRLEQASDKYDDFHEVVLDDHAPFTPHMRAIAMSLPNPEDTLYKLGKDRDALHRVSKLAPHEQVGEMIRLSASLMSPQSTPKRSDSAVIGQVKTTPVSRNGISESSSIREIRERLKGKKY